MPVGIHAEIVGACRDPRRIQRKTVGYGKRPWVPVVIHAEHREKPNASVGIFVEAMGFFGDSSGKPLKIVGDRGDFRGRPWDTVEDRGCP